MEFEYDKAHTKKPNKTSSDHHGDGGPKHQHPNPSSSELMSSAKIVANAAKAQLHHDPNYKFDKGELAGAAENLLHAASQYGKLDEKGGLGKMVGQAEGYLHKYHSSQTTTTTTTNLDHSTTTTTTTETIHTKPHKDEYDGHSGGGYGEYIKMAEGLLNKHSGSGEGGQSGGKYGDYIKMAEGMLKKQSGTDSSEDQHGHHSGSGGGGGGYGDYIKMAENFLKK